MWQMYPIFKLKVYFYLENMATILFKGKLMLKKTSDALIKFRLKSEFLTAHKAQIIFQ